MISTRLLIHRTTCIGPPPMGDCSGNRVTATVVRLPKIEADLLQKAYIGPEAYLEPKAYLAQVDRLEPPHTIVIFGDQLDPFKNLEIFKIIGNPFRTQNRFARDFGRAFAISDHFASFFPNSPKEFEDLLLEWLLKDLLLEDFLEDLNLSCSIAIRLLNSQVPFETENFIAERL